MPNKTGRWILTEKGLEIFDRFDEPILDFQPITDKELIKSILNILVDDPDSVKIGDSGLQTVFKSKKDEELYDKEREYFLNHCVLCGRKLKRTIYHYEKGNICPYCYKKTNPNTILVNNIKID